MKARASAATGFAAALLMLAGCSLPGARDPAPSPTQVRERIASVLPEKLADREGWAEDLQLALEALELPASDEHVCAVVAVTEQESSFRADPVVPDLPRIAMREIEQRAARLHVPGVLLRAALELESANGQSYRQRISKVRTERELSEIYEEFIGEVPLGRRLLADYDPVRTGGPMQVSIAFAEEQARTRRYPFASSLDVRREVFTRRGGLYFGAAHLLAYEAEYDAMRYRFADFNAGQYASRNAALQNALAIASGHKLALDGDLLIDGGASDAIGQTERAARTLSAALGLDGGQLRSDLARGTRADLERTRTWERVFALAEKRTGRSLPRALVPRIALSGPKITRKLTTDWFATRVDGRYQRCLARASGRAPG